MLRKLSDIADQVHRHKVGAEWDVADAIDSGVPEAAVYLLRQIVTAYATAHRHITNEVDRRAARGLTIIKR